MKHVLSEVGADLTNLVEVTVFLTNMADYAEFNKVYHIVKLISRCIIDILRKRLVQPGRPLEWLHYQEKISSLRCVA
jgi:hypothetical protein